MAVLTYGNVTLQVLKTHHVATDDVYDESGLDYLWTRHTFDVTGLVNLANTSYQAQQGNPAPVAQAGQAPFLTVQAIRDTLALPRQPLLYQDEQNNVMVQSPPLAPVGANAFQPGGGLGVNVLPGTQLDCDCDGGPKPLRPAEVLAVHGAGKSVIVRFAVSTTVNDSIYWTAQGGLKQQGQAAPKPPVILSNRWSTSESLDEGAYSTRTYAGRAVFRADLLRDLTITPNDGAGKRLAVPDDFRSYWANFNIPPGFQRRQVMVDQEPSGFAVRYRVVDTQLPVTLTDQRGYKLEVIQILGMASRGVEGMGVEAAFDAAEVAYEIAAGISVDPVASAAHATAAGLRAAIRSLHRTMDFAPKSFDRYVITVSGQPGAKRQDLAKLCYKVLFNYLTAADSFFSSTRATLALDLMGKWAQLTADIERGPFFSSFVKGQGAGVGGAVIDMQGRVPDDDGIKDVTTTTPGTQPPFPSDSGKRGTALEWLVAQSLMYPYTEAPQPVGHSLAGQGLSPP